jgi:hypothetical protein
MNMIRDKKSKMRTHKMVSLGGHSSIPTSSTGDTGSFRLVKRKSTHKDSRTLKAGLAYNVLMYCASGSQKITIVSLLIGTWVKELHNHSL